MTIVEERPVIDAGTLVGVELRETIAADVRARHDHITVELARRGVGQLGRLIDVRRPKAGRTPSSSTPSAHAGATCRAWNSAGAARSTS
ncbi:MULTISPECIES: hypothetical protein [Streptomyces]|uniref:hypothetical protein n=1 Tax=Streptomyces TaxID=1883 RepID=UPI00345B521E